MTYDMFRKPKTIKAYRKHVASLPKDMECEFCTFKEGHPQVEKDYGEFVIVKNKFPYEMWDNYRVIEQYMLIPKRHIHMISEFTPEEDVQFLAAVKEFEESGYCTYSRVPTAKAKSVPHHHIHFIKLSDRHVDKLVYHKKIGHRLLK